MTNLWQAKIVADNLTTAVHCVTEFMIGPIATGVAVIAVAYTGFSALSGRFSLRRTARVLLGLFILFGAQQLGGALLKQARGDAGGSTLTDYPSEQAPGGRMSKPICWTC
jgi:type IV secretory pathway VirB2 component (pilin)